MIQRHSAWLFFATLPLSTASCLGPASVPEMSSAPASMEAEGVHPCSTPRFNNGWQNQAIPYDAELSASDEPASLHGWVFDLEGNPLNTVFIGFTSADTSEDRSSTATDEDGSFHIADVSPGIAQLFFLEAGFMRQTHDVQLLAGRTDTLCVALRYRGMLLPDF